MKLFDVYPLFDIDIVEGRGCLIYDSLGREYLDLYGGHAVISVGHSHPVLCEVLVPSGRKALFLLQFSRQLASEGACRQTRQGVGL